MGIWFRIDHSKYVLIFFITGNYIFRRYNSGICVRLLAWEELRYKVFSASVFCHWSIFNCAHYQTAVYKPDNGLNFPTTGLYLHFSLFNIFTLLGRVLIAILFVVSKIVSI